MPVHLTRQQLIANVRAAIANQTLQLFDPQANACKYLSKDKYVCAIGASLTPEQAREFDAGVEVEDDEEGTSSTYTAVINLIHHNIVTTDDDEFAIELQCQHDHLVACIHRGDVTIEQAVRKLEGFLNAQV